MRWWKALALAAAWAGCGGNGAVNVVVDDPNAGSPPAATSTAIVDENRLPGDPSWAITQAATAHEVEGYARRIRVAPGDAVEVAVNVDEARSVRWALYRVGWYGGAGARRVDGGGPIAVAPQPACPRDPKTSRVECSWATAFTAHVPADALAGVYLVKLTTVDAAALEAYVPLVVRDGRAAEIVLDVNVTTWEAYNPWGGESLYGDASGTMPSGKAWEVSFDRPFAEGRGAGRFLYWEAHLVRFLEALGYDVTYTTGLDLAAAPDPLAHARLFVSAANDEYWLPPARDAVIAARDRGVSLAFLGADQILWRVRLGPSTSGEPDRVMTCYKSDQARDPVAQADPTQTTSRFRDAPDPRPENAIIGVMYDGWLLVDQPFVVGDSTHWVYEGTGLADGDVLPLAVSDEADGVYAASSPAGLQQIADSPFVTADGWPRHAAASDYVAASGAEVVAVGSIGWASGLGDATHRDPRVARMTRNILDRLVGSGRHGGADPDGAPWTAAADVPAPVVVGAWAKRVETVAAGLGGVAGVAVGSDGSVYASDAPGNVIRVVAPGPDHAVSVLAGDGTDGYQDGPGAMARFRGPTGLAVGKDGALYVADTGNHVIRRVAPDAPHTVTTWAGSRSTGGAFLDGPGATASFNGPVALAVDAKGGLVVADAQNRRVRRVAPDAAHTVTTLAGGAGGGLVDGPGATAQLSIPTGVAVGGDGVVYVLDSYNDALRRVAPDAAHTVTTLAGGDPGVFRLVDGDGVHARITGQAGLALVGGKLYVADPAFDRIRVITPGADAASTSVATFAGGGSAAVVDGEGAVAGFAAPMGIAVAPDGSLYVADSGHAAIRHLVP